MAAQQRRRKAGSRKDKLARARKRDFEQPILEAVTRQPARATSNLTDGDIAGPDWKRKLRERGRTR